MPVTILFGDGNACCAEGRQCMMDGRMGVGMMDCEC